MFGIFISNSQVVLTQYCAKYLLFLPNGRIKSPYFENFRHKIIEMRKLKDIFGTQESGGITRRGLLHGAAATALLAAATAFPGAALGETNTFDQRTEMLRYSEDPNHKGIGIFINLQANAPMTGDQIGAWLEKHFASKSPPIPVRYVTNQSRGTATDITFYIKGEGYEVNLGDLKPELDQMLAHHSDQWIRRTSALSTLDQ